MRVSAEEEQEDVVFKVADSGQVSPKNNRRLCSQRFNPEGKVVLGLDCSLSSVPSLRREAQWDLRANPERDLYFGFVFHVSSHQGTNQPLQKEADSPHGSVSRFAFLSGLMK